MLDGELDAYLGYSKHEQTIKNNPSNGFTKKKVKTSFVASEIAVPRDREASFNPILVPKRKSMVDGIENVIVSLYAKGMSTSDIEEQIREVNNFEVSTSTSSRITDAITNAVLAWQNRPLESIYPVVWLDAMHYKVREDGQVKSKAVYSVLGVSMDGFKEVLGIYFGNSESSSFWRQVLNDLQNRGIEDIFIACIDNLSGFGDAIEDYYPETEVQLCLVHQMRNSAKYVTYSDLRAVMKDLKVIYQSPTEQKGLEALEQAREKWNKKYPAIFKSWEKNWDRLSNIYKYSPQLKRIMYTTNPIESYHRMIRKVTKTKGAFASENAILKQVYLAIINAQTKWNGQIFAWAVIRNDLNVYFSDRIKGYDTV